MTDPAVVLVNARLMETHDVTVSADGYTATCGAEVVVDSAGYHCTHGNAS